MYDREQSLIKDLRSPIMQKGAAGIVRLLEWIQNMQKGVIGIQYESFDIPVKKPWTIKGPLHENLVPLCNFS